MNILIGFLTVVHVVVALFMIILVLMQKSKDQGVGAAFGGGVTETVFGAGTTTALVRMTIWCAGIFLAGSLVLTTLHSRRNARGGESLMQRVIQVPPSGSASTVPASATPEVAVPPVVPSTTATGASTPPSIPPAVPPAPQPPAKPQP